MDVVALSLGPAALRLEVPQSSEPAAIAALLRDAAIDGVCDVNEGELVVVVHFDPSTVDGDVVHRSVTALLEHVDRLDLPPAADRIVEIPVVYDGVDLETVAKHCSLSVETIVARHRAAQYRVAFCGFAPGFGYLSGGDPALVVPRRQRPRTRVPAGSVGLAGAYSGVYPSDGPGGWQLIGRTSRTIFDATLSEPALMKPGTSVRFVS